MPMETLIKTWTVTCLIRGDRKGQSNDKFVSKIVTLI